MRWQNMQNTLLMSSLCKNQVLIFGGFLKNSHNLGLEIVLSVINLQFTCFWELLLYSNLFLRLIGSNACSLIAVLIAGRIDDFNLQIWGYLDQPLTRLLVTSIAEAIIEGNELHETLSKNDMLASLNLTVVEALHAVNHKYPFLVEWIDVIRNLFNTRIICIMNSY